MLKSTICFTFLFPEYPLVTESFLWEVEEKRKTLSQGYPQVAPRKDQVRILDRVEKEDIHAAGSLGLGVS